jgi:exodeoxyribonuclease III
MKVITWNCNMAFRKKARLILTLKPDILIIPECEHPDRLKFSSDIIIPNDILWFGINQNKGLGVFSYNNLRLKIIDTYKPEIRTIVPIGVTGGPIDFTLYAIWANNPTDKDGKYIQQVWKAINYYDNQLLNTKTMLIGDFNSNSIWDRKHRESNHSNVVMRLEEKGIYSSYHLFYEQIQGKEEHPTLYMFRHLDKPYHIDYCFVSMDLAKKIKSVEIGEFENWIQYSDHVPVSVTFDLTKQ